LKRVRYGNRTPYFPEFAPDQPPTALRDDSDWMFEIVFDYGEHDPDEPQPGDDPADSNSQLWPVRNDPFSSYRAGFEIRTYRLCRRVLMFHHFPDEPDVGTHCLVRSTDFTYSFERTRRTLARSCREVGGNWAARLRGHGVVDQAARSRSAGERSRVGQPSTRRMVI
jgi:hypothetical protein